MAIDKLLILVVFTFFSSLSSAKTHILKKENVEEELVSIAATVESGDEILIPEGEYELVKPIALASTNISIKGAGPKKTILDFTKQKSGAQSILIRGWDIDVSGFGIRGPQGDGIVIRNSARVRVSDITVAMKDKNRKTPGAYGIYPVNSQHITMRNIEVSGASDAGIYLGQSKHAIIEKTYTYENVTGINIENSWHVNVVNNNLTNNTNGIFIVSLPDMLYSHSEFITLDSNTLDNNNHKNFANEGTLISKLLPGIGVKLVATKNILLKNNTISGHNLHDIEISTYLALDMPPYPGTFSIDVDRNLLDSNAFDGTVHTDASDASGILCSKPQHMHAVMIQMPQKKETCKPGTIDISTEKVDLPKPPASSH